MTLVSWVDALLLLNVVVFTVLGARRHLAGLLVGVGAVLLIKPLLVVGGRSPVVGLLAAAVGGAILALLAHRALPAAARWPRLTGLLGGAGGLLFGSAMLVALAVSLPVEVSGSTTREVYYPHRELPGDLAKALQRSKFVTGVGRAVLFYPLLPPPENDLERRLYATLREWFVVGEPWN